MGWCCLHRHFLRLFPTFRTVTGKYMRKTPNITSLQWNQSEDIFTPAWQPQVLIRYIMARNKIIIYHACEVLKGKSVTRLLLFALILKEADAINDLCSVLYINIWYDIKWHHLAILCIRAVTISTTYVTRWCRCDFIYSQCNDHAVFYLALWLDKVRTLRWLKQLKALSGM